MDEQLDIFGLSVKQTSLDDARRDFKEALHGDGGHCPCCDRWGKIYRRSINKTMLWSLMWLASHAYGEWVDVPNTAPTWLLRSNQLPTLRWWGMVERPINLDDKNKHSGMWRATPIARAWLQGHYIIMPKHVYTYDGEPVQGLGDDETIEAANVVGFYDYGEMMAARADKETGDGS